MLKYFFICNKVKSTKIDLVCCTFVVSKPTSRRVENQLDSRVKLASQQKRAEIRSKSVKTGKKLLERKVRQVQILRP